MYRPTEEAALSHSTAITDRLAVPVWQLDPLCGLTRRPVQYSIPLESHPSLPIVDSSNGSNARFECSSLSVWAANSTTPVGSRGTRRPNQVSRIRVDSWQNELSSFVRLSRSSRDAHRKTARRPHGWTRPVPKSRVSQLLQLFTTAEQEFLNREFLASTLRGGVVRVRIDGVILQLKIEPADFQGWGRGRCRSRRNFRARILGDSSTRRVSASSEVVRRMGQAAFTPRDPPLSVPVGGSASLRVP